MNVTEWLETELTYFKAGIQYISHKESPKIKSSLGKKFQIQVISIFRYNFSTEEIIVFPMILSISVCRHINLVWLRLLYFFNGISTSWGLFNAKIWFISKYLITIITIFSMFIAFLLSIVRCLHTVYGFKYSNLIQII